MLFVKSTSQGPINFRLYCVLYLRSSNTRFCKENCIKSQLWHILRKMSESCPVVLDKTYSFILNPLPRKLVLNNYAGIIDRDFHGPSFYVTCTPIQYFSMTLIPCLNDQILSLSLAKKKRHVFKSCSSNSYYSVSENRLFTSVAIQHKKQSSTQDT